jgi:transcriptional regulator with XRE-family HTH domain
MDEAERRRALADFLRTRRARLKPTDVGLPIRKRRRTPGLRREEVAELANIGVSWYTSLEQGQDVHPSRQVIASLARALRLTPAEERHLFGLSYRELPTEMMEEEDQVPPLLQRVVEALDPHPAFVVDRRWNVHTWNRAANLLLRFDEPCPPHSRNIIWRHFRDEARLFYQDWEVLARVLVAHFRADYARYPGDHTLQEIVEDLQRASPQFRFWWEQQEVQDLPEEPRVMHHPTLGTIEFEHGTFLTPITPDLRMKVYAATPATAARLEEFLFTSSR